MTKVVGWFCVIYTRKIIYKYPYNLLLCYIAVNDLKVLFESKEQLILDLRDYPKWKNKDLINHFRMRFLRYDFRTEVIIDTSKDINSNYF